MQALEVARGKPGLLDQASIEEVSAEGVDVVIRLGEPLATLPAVLAEFRTQILAPAAYAADGTVTDVIGTGPHRVTALVPPLRLTAERFDGYWGAPAAIQDVTYQAIGRVETRALMAESGNADLVVQPRPGQHATARPGRLGRGPGRADPALAPAQARRRAPLSVGARGALP